MPETSNLFRLISHIPSFLNGQEKTFGALAYFLGNLRILSNLTNYWSHIPGNEIMYRNNYYYYHRYSALGPVWAETRAQSVDWYSSATLHPGQVLRGSLPLLSPAFRRSHFRHQVPQRRERS